ncbi:hypothetical protein D9M69_695420 [compost metagenome]
MSPSMYSTSLTALSLFGAFLTSAAAETFTWVPPPAKVVLSGLIASNQPFCSFFAWLIRPI